MKYTRRKYSDISLVPKQKYYPLSFQQERILHLCERYSDSSYWNRVYCKHIKGKLDTSWLRLSINKVVELHETLRTKIKYIDGIPMQSIGNINRQYMECIDLNLSKSFDKKAEAMEIYHQACLSPIDVLNNQMFKIVLIILNESEYFLILKLHHIITDATTIRIIWRDLKKIYNSYFGLDEHSKPLELNYKDFVLWQKTEFDEANTMEQEEYWINKFTDVIPMLDLPTDGLRNDKSAANGTTISKSISQEFVKKLNSYSLKHRVTLFSALLSAYYLLLNKYCNQSEIVVGTVFSGRHYNLHLKDVAGFFINTVALSKNVNKDLSIMEFVQEIQEDINEAYYMQDYPFQRLVQKLNQRSNIQNPMFRVMFNMVTEYPETEFYGIDEEKWVPTITNSTQTDLLLDIINKNNDEIEIKIEYNTSLFQKETISDILNNYIELLQTIMKVSDKKIGEVAIPLSKEQQSYLHEYNNTSVMYDTNVLLHQLFEVQVKKTPNKVAVIFENQKITYEELNKKSNYLATRLRDHKVYSNQLVGIMIDRSINMIIGVMGILKAGAAYLPIDPSYPKARIEYILEHSQTNVIVTEHQYSHLIKSNIEILQMDEYNSSSYLDHNLEIVNSPKDLAYTIYTSGSTGKPKGVMISHEAVVNTIIDVNNKFSVSQEDNVIALSSVTFDLSVYDIFGALSIGATLVEINDQRNVSEILEALEKNDITVWNSVPAIMEMLLQNTDSDYQNTKLSLVMLSGDWISIGLPEKIKNKFPNAQIISLGGATEASIWSIYHQIKEVDKSWTSIPYGRPLANQMLYVLDNELNPCPVGVRGELYIGGVGVAKGYLNDNEKTRNVFKEHNEFGYLYRTGDLGRFRREGYIEFLGRKDQQTKIRGYRIELEEIDKSILSYPSIRESVSIVREDVPGNKYIASYILIDKDVNFSINKLKDYIKNWLPHYMLPSAIVQLESIPLTSNGKVDRNMLPQPSENIEFLNRYVAPRNEEEIVICNIWKEVLKKEQIGVHDDFFLLGGHSLIATQILVRINAIYRSNYSLNKMWDLLTVAEWAKYVQESIKMNHKDDVRDMNTENREVGSI